MIPVTQTVLGEGGNCFSACLASILEMGIDEVPNFHGENVEDYWVSAKAWLAKQGWGIVSLALSEDFTPGMLGGWQIICGESPRGLMHATVWKDGKLVHDPHPDRTGIVTEEFCDLLYPLDAAKMRAP